MILSIRWDFGKTLYVITDTDQKPRQLTAVLHMPGDRMQYQLACGSNSSWHYEFEISEEVNTLAKTTG